MSMFSQLTSWLSDPGKDKEESSKEISQDDEGERDESNSSEAWGQGLGGLVSSVSGYASTIKESVKSTVMTNTFISDFQEEQKKFEREQRRQKDAAVPPWVGYNEEDQMKAQILELSADSRNVLRNPPPGVQFHFDFAKSYPVALALLKEDPRLQKMRFELVPKKVKEERFWHNYFYRVFLIKQSSQLATLSEQKATDTAESSTASGEDKVLPEHFTEPTSDVEPQSPVQEADFASDALVRSEEGEAISKESVREELDQLGVSQSQGDKETEKWEQELARELEDLGLSPSDEAAQDHVDSEQWETEIQQMLELHSEQD